MIEPAINNYLLKSQMSESSKCQFSGLLEGFNKLSSCKEKKKSLQKTNICQRVVTGCKCPFYRMEVLCASFLDILFQLRNTVQDVQHFHFFFFLKLARCVQMTLSSYVFAA